MSQSMNFVNSDVWGGGQVLEGGHLTRMSGMLVVKRKRIFH